MKVYLKKIRGEQNTTAGYKESKGEMYLIYPEDVLTSVSDRTTEEQKKTGEKIVADGRY